MLCCLRQAQADQTETQIKEEFLKLHRFLRGEEEVRIAALRKEERDKTADLEEKMEAVLGGVESEYEFHPAMFSESERTEA